jgi:SulP family sulfate permease
MMMEREGEKLRHRVPTQTEESPESSPPEEMDKTPMPRRIALESVTSEVDLTGESTPTARPRSLAENQSEGSEGNDLSALRRFLAAEVERVDVESGYETTPLLGGRNRRWSEWLQQDLWSVGQRASKITARDVVRGCIEEPIKTLPAVILGLLLNVLDGVSYGMILYAVSTEANCHLF